MSWAVFFCSCAAQGPGADADVLRNFYLLLAGTTERRLSGLDGQVRLSFLTTVNVCLCLRSRPVVQTRELTPRFLCHYSAAMAGSFAYVWKDRTQTTTQKIIQARMIAQGATILLILGAGWIYSTGPQVRLLRAVSRPSRWLVRLTALSAFLTSSHAGAEARRPLLATSSAFHRLESTILSACVRKN